jgi:hypothetical protein
MKSWYLELIISDELSEKVRQWEINTGKDGEQLIHQLLEQHFNNK